MRYPPILILGCHILTGTSLVLATVGKTLLGSLLSYTAMLGFSSYQEERSMPTFMFRLFLVDEIKLFFLSGTKLGLLDIIRK